MPGNIFGKYNRGWNGVMASRWVEARISYCAQDSPEQQRLTTTCLDYTNHHMDIFKIQVFFFNIKTASNIYYMLIYYVICTG